MIVVVGSRHDRAATGLVRAWPGATLCSAEDITRPGWNCRTHSPVAPRWVIGGRAVEDRQLTGVFLRRSCFYPEEFASTHPDDRAYLAAEAQAFLAFLLAETRARVASPVVDGAFGDEALRPERWIPAALESDLAVAPVRLTSRQSARRRLRPHALEVVGDQCFGEAPARLKAAAVRMAGRLGMCWATIILDGRHQMLTVTATRPPSEAALGALGRLLAAPVPA